MKKAFRILIFIAITFFINNVSVGSEKIREFHKDFGFAVSLQQFEAAIKIAESRESSELEKTRQALISEKGESIAAGICPHDDYTYAAQVYLHIIPYIKAKHIVIFGVAHKAKDFNSKDQLIFGDFTAWDTVAGALKVSSLQHCLLNHLNKTDYVISDDFMNGEHSIEALTHWLKYYNPEAEIVPVCVPYMKWDRMQEIAGSLADALLQKMKEEGWILGRDIAFLISNDSSHYGDQGWGGRNYAPFGTSVKGYLEATGRDIKLMNDYLAGTLEIEKLKSLFHSLVKADDPYTYQITWCGRFCLPLALSTLKYLTDKLQVPTPGGIFLNYGTSVELGLIEDESIKPPLETTAPTNLHHWVGYLAMAFK